MKKAKKKQKCHRQKKITQTNYVSRDAAPHSKSSGNGTIFSFLRFYARKQLLLSARLSRRNSVRLSVRLYVTWVDQSKAVQARITTFSPLTTW